MLTRAHQLRKADRDRTENFDADNVTIGESMSLTHDIPRADELMERLVTEACFWLAKFAPPLAWRVYARGRQYPATTLRTAGVAWIISANPGGRASVINGIKTQLGHIMRYLL
jgi:hypothetical protein